MAKRKDYTGKRYGHLVMLKFVRSNVSGLGSTWLALCDCGNQKEVTARMVACGRVKTCGNCEYSRRLRTGRVLDRVNGKSQEKKMWKRLYTAAMAGDVPWTIEWTQFLNIIKKECNFCGEVPRQNVGEYSRVDLIGRTLGYTLDNCQPICKACQTLKGQRNYVEFLDLVLKIAHNISSKII